jgi:hypothetical protein
MAGNWMQINGITCPECRSQMSAGENFCVSCGTIVATNTGVSTIESTQFQPYTTLSEVFGNFGVQIMQVLQNVEQV